MPYIILRQNDWVLQVRQAASEAFDKRMQNLAKGEILTALPFAEKLKWSNRGSRGEYTQKFFDKLVSREHREDLIKGLQSDNIRTRRICIGALFEVSQPDIELALNQLKHEPEPFLRTILFEKIRKTGQDMNEPSLIMLRDKFARNRILALQYLHDKQDEPIYDISMKMLLDKDTHVRALARNIIKQHSSNFDFRLVYIENIEQSSATAILGLGETGRANDTEIIERYLNDNRIAIVRAALISLMRLNSEKYKTLITEKLADSRIVLNGIELNLGFHFEPRKNGYLNELEFFVDDYSDRDDTYIRFQTNLESVFGKPTKTDAGTWEKSMPTHTWKKGSVIIQHYVFDRFGPEEHVRIKNLIKELY